MWSRSILVRVEQLQNGLASSPSALLRLADENGHVVVSNVDEGFRIGVPEEQAVFSTFVSLDPEPSRLELEFGLVVKRSGITQIRGTSLSLLCDMESLTRNQEWTLGSFLNFKQRGIIFRQLDRRIFL